MKAFEFAVAKTEAGIHDAVGRGYRIKAGGIDLLDLLKERIEPSDKVVSILGVEPLRGIRETDKGLEIGALTTLAELIESPVANKAAKALVDSVRNAASPQLRAVATLGGNICQRPRCWYFRSGDHECLKKGGSTCFAVDGDNTYHALFGKGPCHIVHASNAATALVALGAEIEAASKTETRTIAAARFFVPPERNIYGENSLDEGELVRAIRVPGNVEKSAYVDFKEKQSFDWPLASCCVAKVGGKWNVVLGAVAPVPWVAAKAAELLNASTAITHAVAEAVADAAIADASPMSGNAWRVKLARAAVRRAVLVADGKDIDP